MKAQVLISTFFQRRHPCLTFGLKNALQSLHLDGCRPAQYQLKLNKLSVSMKTTFNTSREYKRSSLKRLLEVV